MAQTVIDWSQSYATWIAGDGAALGNFSIAAGTSSPRPWTFANLINSYIAADYELTHRGTACSIKGRAANSTGVIADISAATLGHVLRRDATPVIGFGTLLAGAFATGPGIVTPAMLDNGSARTVLGRSANSAGARADISGAGTSTVPQVLSDNGTTVAFRSMAALDTLYEVDFSTLANNTFADGAETIDGLPWVVANAAELATFDILNGTGLRAVVAASNGGASTMTSASQLAAYLYIELEDIPGYRPEHQYVFEIYCSAATHEANGEGVMLGLWGVAADPNSVSVARMRAGALVNGTAFDRVIRSTITTTNLEGTDDRTGHNVLAIRLDPMGQGMVSSGTWSGDWPATDCGLSIPTSGGGSDPFNHGTVRLFLAFPTANDASPTTSTTVQRLRIRRV